MVPSVEVLSIQNRNNDNSQGLAAGDMLNEHDGAGAGTIVLDRWVEVIIDTTNIRNNNRPVMSNV